MKNFLGTLAFLSMLLVFACTKQTAQYVPVEDTDAAGALLPTPNRDKAFVDATYDALPAAAKTYLAANTDITKITNIVKITLANGRLQDGVRTSTNTHFLFDADGKLIAKRG